MSKKSRLVNMLCIKRIYLSFDTAFPYRVNTILNIKFFYRVLSISDQKQYLVHSRKINF